MTRSTLTVMIFTRLDRSSFPSKQARGKQGADRGGGGELKAWDNPGTADGRHYWKRLVRLTEGLSFDSFPFPSSSNTPTPAGQPYLDRSSCCLSVWGGVGWGIDRHNKHSLECHVDSTSHCTVLLSVSWLGQRVKGGANQSTCQSMMCAVREMNTKSFLVCVALTGRLQALKRISAAENQKVGIQLPQSVAGLSGGIGGLGQAAASKYACVALML